MKRAGGSEAGERRRRIDKYRHYLQSEKRNDESRGTKEELGCPYWKTEKEAGEEGEGGGRGGGGWG